jgi:hypothetical protein
VTYSSFSVFFSGSESSGCNYCRFIELLVAAYIIKVFVSINDQIDIGGHKSDVAQRVSQIAKMRIDSRIDHDGLIGPDYEVHVAGRPLRLDLEDVEAHFEGFFL